MYARKVRIFLRIFCDEEARKRTEDMSAMVKYSR